MLTPSNCQVLEFQNTTRVATIPEGTPYEKVLTSEYWSLVMGSQFKLNQWDTIQVREESGEYFAWLLVRAINNNIVSLEELTYKPLKKAVSEHYETGNYIVEFKGPVRKWEVINKMTKEVIMSGLQGKDNALKWAAEHAKALAA